MDLRKAIIANAVVVLALGSVAGCSRSPTQAQAPGDQKTTVERKTTTSSGNIRQVSVTVKDVDRDEHKVTFEARVSPEANIMSNGQPIALDQLQKGDSIRLSFDTASGEVVKAEVLRKARK